MPDLAQPITIKGRTITNFDEAARVVCDCALETDIEAAALCEKLKAGADPVALEQQFRDWAEQEGLLPVAKDPPIELIPGVSRPSAPTDN